MSKRYFSHDDLLPLTKEEHYKPAGTMGSHAMVCRKKGENIVVQGIDVRTGRPKSKEIFIQPGWSLCYDAGACWPVKPAHLIKNPVLRFLRENKLPKSFVEYVDELPEEKFEVLVDRDLPEGSVCIGWRSAYEYIAGDVSVIKYRDWQTGPIESARKAITLYALKSASKEEVLKDLQHLWKPRVNRNR